MVLMDVGALFVVSFVWSPDIIRILDNNLFRIFCRKQHVVATAKKSHTNIVTLEKKEKEITGKRTEGGGVVNTNQRHMEHWRIRNRKRNRIQYTEHMLSTTLLI